MPARRGVLCLLPLLLVPGLRASAEDFALHLERPAAVGRPELLSGTFDITTTMRLQVQGREVQQEKHEVYRFEVVATVLSLSAKGRPQEEEIRIRSLTYDVDGATTSLLAKGDRVTVRLAQGKKVYELRGKELAKDAQKALGKAVFLRADDEPTDDETFGSRERRKVGDSWPVRPEIVSRALAENLTGPLPAENVKGTVQFAARRLLDNSPSLELHSKLDIKSPPLKLEDLPPELTVKVQSLQLTDTEVLPVEPVPGPRESTIRMEGTMALSGTIQGVATSGQLQFREEANVHSSPIR